jgi:hypothetical protein
MTDHSNPAWQFVTFAQRLREGLDRWRDEAQALARGQGVGATAVREPLSDAPQRLRVSGDIVQRLDTILTPSRVGPAFGDGTHPGDEAALFSLADDVIAVYADLIHWARQCLGCQVPENATLLYQALAAFVRQPLIEIETFVDNFSTAAATIDDDLAHGRPPSPTLRLTLKVTVDPVAQAAIDEALRRLAPRRRWFQRR